MKRLRLCLILLLVLILGSVLAPSARAVSDEVPEGLSFREAERFRTLVTDTEGETYWHDGVLDVSSLGAPDSCPELASYAVYCGENVILEAELHRLPSAGEGASLQSVSPASNGYYAVQFDISADQLAFITGLTANNLEAVQQELIWSRQNGTQFDMTHVDYIDAEKLDFNVGEGIDSNLCWAAAASNVLHYTGWGLQANASFTTPDEIFEQFIGYFDDEGLTEADGIRWFFSGVNLQQGETDAAQVRNSYGLYGFLPDYAPDHVMHKCDIVDWRDGSSSPLSMETVLSLLRDGWGCTVGIGWYQELFGPNYKRDGGHAVTLWGYVRNKSFQGYDPRDYTALLITDSDSDNEGNYSGYDAWSAQNRMLLTEISPIEYIDYSDINNVKTYGKDFFTWEFPGFRNEDEIGFLEDFTVLQPYDKEIAKENWNLPHGERFSYDTLDISAFVQLYDSSDLGYWNTAVFQTGDEGTATVSLFYGWQNFLYSWSNAHPLQADITIRDSSGKTVYSNSGQDTVYLGEQEWGWSDSIELPDGEYTATINVKILDGSREAYYTNNTCTKTFSVVDPSKRKLELTYTGLSGQFLIYNILCEEPAEYGKLLVRYQNGKEWSDWEDWGDWVQSVWPKDYPSIYAGAEPEKGEYVMFQTMIHREGHDYVLTSDPVLLAVPWSLSAQVEGSSLDYDLGIPADETADLFAAAYDENGRMIDLQHIQNATAGKSSLAVPQAVRYKAFLLRDGVPMCPAWCWPEE